MTYLKEKTIKSETVYEGTFLTLKRDKIEKLFNNKLKGNNKKHRGSGRNNTISYPTSGV